MYSKSAKGYVRNTRVIIYVEIYQIISHWRHLRLKMSKQTLGDGLFWEKDDYFNLEDEKTRGAARSGRNPNAPAWDPEEMELLRMVASRGKKILASCHQGQRSRQCPTKGSCRRSGRRTRPPG